MPCDSRITQTQMTDAERVAEAMRDLGHASVVVSTDGRTVSSRTLSFTRYNSSGAFNTSSSDTTAINAVRKGYTDLSVRAVAKRRGFTIQSEETENGGTRLTLVNRRTK